MESFSDYSAFRLERNNRGTKNIGGLSKPQMIRNKEMKITLFIENMVVYQENPRG